MQKKSELFNFYSTSYSYFNHNFFRLFPENFINCRRRQSSLGKQLTEETPAPSREISDGTKQTSECHTIHSLRQYYNCIPVAYLGGLVSCDDSGQHIVTVPVKKKRVSKPRAGKPFIFIEVLSN